MTLTPALVEEAVNEYSAVQPLAAVEAEHVEMLPGTFAGGEYGWRDAEWVVQWHFRRHLGAYPDDERRAVEAAYGENSYEDVHDAIDGAIAAATAAEKLAPLTDLEGVDVGVGSAFLQFLDPERYLVVSPREWSVLRAAGELDGDYPDPVTVPEYERYLETSRSVADRCACDCWDLYRATWVLAERDEFGDPAVE